MRRVPCCEVPGGGSGAYPGGTMRRLYLVLGAICLLLGAVGAAVPLLPTVPFLLLAAWCFGRSSPRLERRLLEHPRFGPPVRAWREHGVVSLPGKLAATVAVAASVGLTLTLVDAPRWALIAAAAVPVGVLLFLWTRPSRLPESARSEEPPTRAGAGRG